MLCTECNALRLPIQPNCIKKKDMADFRMMTHCSPIQPSPLCHCISQLHNLINTVCMYENVQAPMLEAVAGGNTPASASLAVNPFKTLLQGGNASGLLVTVRRTACVLL